MKNYKKRSPMKTIRTRLFAGTLAAMTVMTSFGVPVMADDIAQPAEAVECAAEAEDTAFEDTLVQEETNLNESEEEAAEPEAEPAEETTEEAPAAESEEAPAEETVEEAPAEETAAEDTAEEAPEEVAETDPANEETATEDTATEETTTEEAAAEENTEETPAGESEETPATENSEEAPTPETEAETEEEANSETSMENAAPAASTGNEAMDVVLGTAQEADPVAEEEEESEEDNKELNKLVNTVTELGLDALEGAIPGGKFILGPLKAIFGDKLKLDEGEDPVDKLAKAQQKNFDRLNKRIQELNDNMDTYTKFLSNKTVNESEKQTLREMFMKLSSKTQSLSFAISGIMKSNYSDVEKLLRIADLTNGYKNSKYTEDIVTLSDMISSTMGNKGTKLDMNMYQSILNMCKENYLFEGEAHAEAMITAEALMEQYLYANTLVLQCQNAVGDLKNLSPEQLEVIMNDPKLKKMYEGLMEEDKVRFEKSQYEATVKRINKGATSYKKFSDRDVEGNRFNNKGTLQDKSVAFDINGKEVKGSDESTFNSIYKKQYFDSKKLTELVGYIKERTGGKTCIAEFLRNNHVDVPYDYMNVKSRYIIVDPTVRTIQDKNRFATYEFWNIKAPAYHVRQTIKVIDIYDPECKVQDLVIKTWDYIDGHPTLPSKNNIKEYTHHYFTIEGHVATEKDNYTKQKKVGNLNIQGPRRHYKEHEIPGPKTKK